MSYGAAEQFDRVASAYATSAVHAQGADLAWLLETLRPEPTWHVLDLGTGAGHTALAVAPQVAQVTAVDVSERMLHTAADLAAERGITNVAFRQADVAMLPFAQGSFQAAVSRFSAHHWPDPAAALHAATHVLDEHASLIVIDTISPEEPVLDTFINAVELLRDPSHVRDARRSEWQRLLQEAGFVLEAAREWQIELMTDEWLARSATEPWRAEACRKLLQEGPGAAANAFAVAADGTRFSLRCALLAARRQ